LKQLACKLHHRITHYLKYNNPAPIAVVKYQNMKKQ